MDVPPATPAATPLPTPDAGGDVASAVPLVGGVAVVGAGRVGRAVAAGLRAAGIRVDGPLGRGADAATCDVVLLAVPDAQIGVAAAALAAHGPGGAAARVVGHLSGATALDVLAGRRALVLHPLMTVTGDPGDLRGAPAAVDGTDPGARDVARALSGALGMRPIDIAARDRVAYHAAACVASNYLVTVLWAAERLGATAGLPRDALVPLLDATVRNWATLGARAALTGPVARGDVATVAAQRAAVADRTPDLLPLFDAMTDATGRLAATEG